MASVEPVSLVRVRRLLLAFVLLTVVAVPAHAAPATTASGVACSAGSTPETGVQGQVPLADQLSGRSKGYSCNLRMVGSNDLAGRGGDTQMTWYGNCAYFSAGWRQRGRGPRRHPPRGSRGWCGS